MGAFQLDVAAGGLATLTFDAPDRRVNVFDRAVLAELGRRVGELAGRSDIRCLVLLSAKPGHFSAGADIELIASVADPAEAAAGVRLGQEIFAAWEALPFPTVAAIAGTCVGGGTELALASTFRVVADRAETRVGLPEVRIGVVPAWGGCTRLPRRVGLRAALDLILTGRAISARRAFEIGFADALLPASGFLGHVRDFATAAADGRRPADAAGGFRELLEARNPLGRGLVLELARRRTLTRTRGRYPAPLAALEVVRAGLEGGPRAGFAAEARAAAELVVAATAKNLIHVFKLHERAKKTPLGDAGAEDLAPRPVRAAAVVGAGIMGAGIASLIAERAGIPVRLKDVASEPLAAGMAHAAARVRARLDRRRLEPPQARRELALIQPSLDYGGFARADLVVEAIVEDLGAKQRVFAELAAAVGPETVLASNTSSLSIDAIAGDIAHPERVVGMHFFKPVDRMPLVEVIAGARSSKAAVAAVAALARRLGKVPVPVQDAPGFLVNRLLGFASVEALQLLDEGYAIDDLDAALRGWGMPLGPLELTDEVGINVAFAVARVLSGAFADRLPLPAWIDRPVADGRLGKKNGRGFYQYRHGRRTRPDPAVYALIGVTPGVARPDRRYLAERMVLPMVNEVARCLAEGVVAAAADADLALILGCGFPPFRGGLCRWADDEGLAALIATLERFAAAVGERHRPSDALREAAEAGGFYARF